MNTYISIMKNPNIIWVNSNLLDDRINSNHYKEKILTNIENILKSGLHIFKLKDIVEINRRGKGLSKLINGQIPNYKVRNLTNFGINNEPDYISKEDFTKNTSCHIKKGDVLLASTGVGSLGKVDLFYGNFPATVDGHIAILRTKKNYDSGYLKSYLQCKYGQVMIEQNTLGSTGQTELYPKDIDNFIIPIPSPEIQKYIGDKVRKAEELREEAKRLKKESEDILYTQLKQEQYLQKQKSLVNKYVWLSDKEIETRIDSEYYKPNYILFKYILNKNGIKTKKIKDIVIDIKTGTTPQDKYITKDEKRIKFLRVNNLGYCILEKDDMLYVSDKYDDKKLRIIPKGNILVSIAGTLGRSSVVDLDNCTTNQNIAALTLKNTNFIKPYYLSLYFNSYFGNLALETTSTQATVKYINNELLGEIEVPIIDIDIQLAIEEKIVRYKDKISKSKQLIQEAKQDVEDLIEGNFDMSKVKANN